MAEDIRKTDSPGRVIEERAAALVAECRRQEESCLYTSTTLYIWLREARLIRRVFVVTPVVLAALATWSVLNQPTAEWLKWLTATFALVAGLFPAVYEALKLDTHIDEITRQAALFKNLQDRFRQAATVASLGPYDEFQATFDSLMERMDAARSVSITPPERCFKAAQQKVQSGDYRFDSETAMLAGSGLDQKR